MHSSTVLRLPLVYIKYNQLVMLSSMVDVSKFD
jgi:hypothetical protein